MANNPSKRLYRVTIAGGEPLTIEAAHSFEAHDMALQAVGSPDVRVEVQLLDDAGKFVTFPHMVLNHHLQEARLREARHTDDWHRRNDAQARGLQFQYMDAMRRAGAV